mgnify:CR=1 FL=1|jgi:hypothetical protein
MPCARRGKSGTGRPAHSREFSSTAGSIVSFATPRAKSWFATRRERTQGPCRGSLACDYSRGSMTRRRASFLATRHPVARDLPC